MRNLIAATRLSLDGKVEEPHLRNRLRSQAKMASSEVTSTTALVTGVSRSLGRAIAVPDGRPTTIHGE